MIAPPRSTATLSCATSGCAYPIHRLRLLRTSRLRASRPVSLPSTFESLTSGTHFPRKSFLLRTYRKRSSGQDGRPESRLGDEGSLRGALHRNVTIARENKCFILRTYNGYNIVDSSARVGHNNNGCLPSVANGLILMLESYFDESENDSFIGGHPLLVIAGYLSEKSSWDSFNDRWKSELLGPFRIPYFHSKDLRSQNARLYRHLSFERRRELLRKATTIIRDVASLGVVGYIRPHDWKQFASMSMRSRWGSSYGILMELLLSTLSEYRQSTERVSVFLENGHGNADDAIRKIRAIQQATEPVEPLDLPDEVMDVSVLEEDQARTRMMRIGDVALISKLTSAPTQAADLLAYLMASSCLKKPHPVFEGVFDELLEGTPHILITLESEESSRTCCSNLQVRGTAKRTKSQNILDQENTSKLRIQSL